MSEFRLEHDLLGEKQIPATRYYGIQTQRALENFAITEVPISHFPEFIRAFAYVKKAAAMTNFELELLPPKICKAICEACDEIIQNKLMDEFVVDVMQGGGGTSTNMNVNEVIANRALEILGYEKGCYDIIHPNIHVNMSQSTNDVYPTSLRLALYVKLSKLIRELKYFKQTLVFKGKEFADVIKMGRTELQDAVPLTLGQAFTAYAITVGEDIERINEAQALLRDINLGATAVGTGINAHPDYARIVTEKLRDLTDVPVITAEDLIEATQDTGGYVQLSGVLKRVAVKVSKICNDLRLISSGPRAGLNEINLPRVQPGSTIMPGKVNPVIPDAVNQVAYQVIGADVTITLAAESGQLELNAMEPVIALNLLQSINMLMRAYHILAERCIVGITANKEHCRKMVENSIGLVTALNPIIGYEQASQVAQEAFEKNKSVCEIVLEKDLMSKGELEEVLSPDNMMKPRLFVRNQAGT